MANGIEREVIVQEIVARGLDEFGAERRGNQNPDSQSTTLVGLDGFDLGEVDVYPSEATIDLIDRDDTMARRLLCCKGEEPWRFWLKLGSLSPSDQIEILDFLRQSPVSD